MDVSDAGSDEQDGPLQNDLHESLEIVLSQCLHITTILCKLAASKILLCKEDDVIRVRQALVEMRHDFLALQEVTSQHKFEAVASFLTTLCFV